MSDSAPEHLTREQRRSRRKRKVRARTVSIKRMTKRELELGRLLYPEDTRTERPRTRGECAEGHRPCPFVSCKHHLYLDVSTRTGAIKMNFPDLEVDQMTESCALDVADRGGEPLEKVGEVLNMTRERVRQVEVAALAKMERIAGGELAEAAGYDESSSAGPLASPREPTDEDEDEFSETPDEPERQCGQGDELECDGRSTAPEQPGRTCRRTTCPWQAQPNDDPELDGLCRRHRVGAENARRARERHAAQLAGTDPPIAPEPCDGREKQLEAAPAAPHPEPFRGPVAEHSAPQDDPATRVLVAPLRELLDAWEIVDAIGWERARALANEARTAVQS